MWDRSAPCAPSLLRVTREPEGAHTLLPGTDAFSFPGPRARVVVLGQLRVTEPQSIPTREVPALCPVNPQHLRLPGVFSLVTPGRSTGRGALRILPSAAGLRPCPAGCSAPAARCPPAANAVPCPLSVRSPRRPRYGAGAPAPCGMAPAAVVL